MHPIDVVVIGGGICGLTAAHRLHKAGLSTTLVEREPYLGGKIQTRNHEGFMLELGPNTMHSRGQALMDLCQELNLPLEPTAPLAKKRYLYLNEKLTALPTDPLSFLASPVLPIGAKLRMMQEPWLRSHPVSNDETVADFTRRRLGEKALDNLMAPFLSGVYAGDPETLSLQAVFPKLAHWEQRSGSIVKGLMASRKDNKRTGRKPKYQLLSLDGGMQRLIQGLSESIPNNQIRLGVSVQRIERVHDTYHVQLEHGETLLARAILLATPAKTTAQLLFGLVPDASPALEAIPYATLTVVHMGLPHTQIRHPLDGFGFLAPKQSGLDLLGSIWSSSLFPNRAPQGQALLTCMLGGATRPDIVDWEDEKLTDVTLRDLALSFGQPKESLQPTMVQVSRYFEAIPQYTVGHLDRVRHIEGALRQSPGLFATGNYLKGVSLNDCVTHANETAADLLNYLIPPDSSGEMILQQRRSSFTEISE